MKSQGIFMAKNKRKKKQLNIDELTPQELVLELDRYIVGQAAAKKTVAIALRNRIRRSLLDEDLQRDITPKNIIMIGSTGVGKTEIARRLSQLSGGTIHQSGSHKIHGSRLCWARCRIYGAGLDDGSGEQCSQGNARRH